MITSLKYKFVCDSLSFLFSPSYLIIFILLGDSCLIKMEMFDFTRINPKLLKIPKLYVTFISVNIHCESFSIILELLKMIQIIFYMK